MGLVDIRLELGEEDYSFVRWQAVKLNSSIANYIKRLIAEERRRKKQAGEDETEHV